MWVGTKCSKTTSCNQSVENCEGSWAADGGCYKLHGGADTRHRIPQYLFREGGLNEMMWPWRGGWGKWRVACSDQGPDKLWIHAVFGTAGNCIVCWSSFSYKLQFQVLYNQMWLNHATLMTAQPSCVWPSRSRLWEGGGGDLKYLNWIPKVEIAILLRCEGPT